MTTFSTASSAQRSVTSVIDPVTRNGFCTGCGLCAAVAPKGAVSMRISREGYLRPVVNAPLTPEVTQAISATCPGITLSHPKGTKRTDTILGPLISVQTGHAEDPEIRRQGSSGGVLSAIATHLLATGQVDFVAQIAVSHDDPLQNALQISTSRADVIRAAGSRYSPSAPLQSLRELLATGKRFAFIGKPCDVAALRQYARIDPAVDRQVPYMLSFMCAGLPSLKGTDEVISALGAKKEELASFRYRGDGWPGMAKATHKDGQTFEMDYNTSWGNILGKHLQFRCKICPDGTGEFADLVCADAWYGADGYPDFTERDGRSLILARTPAGQELLSEAIEHQAISSTPLATEEISKMQPYQFLRKKLVLGRLLAARLAIGSAPRYINLGNLKAALMNSPISFLRNAWGTYKRAKPELQ